MSNFNRNAVKYAENNLISAKEEKEMIEERTKHEREILMALNIQGAILQNGKVQSSH
jgi:hypothetical protein